VWWLFNLQFWCALKMTELKELCVFTKLCFKLVKNSTEVAFVVLWGKKQVSELFPKSDVM
jgi:hypothetical protein